ncbi:ABC transporter substrate-binding protein [Chloroflexota bacterium]
MRMPTGMARKLLAVSIIWVLLASLAGGCQPTNAEKAIGIAVEFNNHDACAYVAQAKGWFEEEGLKVLPVFQIHESGAAVAAAMARGDIQIGYMGLTAAIMLHARGIPIKIVAGIHQGGYGLAVRPGIKDVADLENKTIGCLREGTVTDLLLNLMIAKYQLKDITVLRMSPPEEVLNLITGRLDGALIPEQHATTAQSQGFPLLITSQDLWPDIPGDVLVVSTGLIEDNPELVRRLVKVTRKATAWINDHPDEAAEIMAVQLQAAGEKIFPTRQAKNTVDLRITPEIMSRSMARLKYTTAIDAGAVQDIIDRMVELGYVDEGTRATDILNLRYLEGE